MSNPTVVCAHVCLDLRKKTSPVRSEPKGVTVRVSKNVRPRAEMSRSEMRHTRWFLFVYVSLSVSLSLSLSERALQGNRALLRIFLVVYVDRAQ